MAALDRGRVWVPPSVALLAGTVPYLSVLSLPLLSPDTWPSIVADQVRDLTGLRRVLFGPLMSGTDFATTAAYYHPTTSLTFTFDVALFGLNAAGYHATNLALHACAIVALYSLGLGVGLTRWAAALSAVTFGIHPISEAAVPDIPRRQDIVVAVFLLASLSALARSTAASGPKRGRLLALALCLYFLALGGKEVAYAALGAVPFVILAAQQPARAHEANTGLNLAWVVGATACFVAVELIGFGIRWEILGGFGGGADREGLRGRFDSVPELFVQPYITFLVWPLRGLLPTNLRGWTLLAIAAIGLGAGALYVLPRRHRWIVCFGLALNAGFLLLYVVVRNSIGAYGLYAALAGFALLVGAVLEGSVRRVRMQPRGSGVRAWLIRVSQVGLLATGAACAVLVAGSVRSSPLLTPYPEWSDAARVSTSFVAQLRPCLNGVPDRMRVEFDGLPQQVEYGTDESVLIDARILADYSLPSLLAVYGYDGRFQTSVVPETGFSIRRPPESVNVVCQTTSPGEMIVTTRVE